jgi:predicted amino acid racemase
MFLDVTVRRNSSLIEAAIKLHQRGLITPNTYVLDLDRIVENAQLIKDEADRNQINLYMMTKQIGRNPKVAEKIAEVGIKKAVAVDPWEALSLAKHGIRIGNVGHLVQVPSAMIAEVLAVNPEVVTVFSVEKAQQISLEATKQNKVQDILLKVVDPEDFIYEGQEGGVSLATLAVSAREIMKYPGVNIVGVTAFPCFLYNEEKHIVEGTPNSRTLIQGARLLEKEPGLNLTQINAPSANSVTSISMIKELGATHGEPGHAFTGTIPINSQHDQPETPALVYVSEISHCLDGKAYAFGGGFYRRGNVRKAMVGSSFEQALGNVLEVAKVSPSSIDYYGELMLKGHQVRVGDTVVYAFRTQIFVTRSEVAVVEGIGADDPRIVGIYDSLGNLLR